ncbi:MAG: glycosyltransferase family 2 protein [Candidatus Aminicenantales bacterium]
MSIVNKEEPRPELSVIMVNYNDRQNLGQSLAALSQAQLDFSYEIIVVDNNSSDGSKAFLEENYPQIKLICNQENKGFARACNQGIRASRGPYLLFLNPDAVIKEQALSILMRGMRSNLRVAAVGPALIKDSSRYQISFGKKPTFGLEFLQKCLLNYWQRLWLKFSSARREVSWLSGACLLVRRQALERVGFFDEKFFLYFEDIDLCLRMKAKGWKLIYLPQAKAYHQEGVSTVRLGLGRRFAYRQSQLYFYRKHNSKFSYYLLYFYLLINFSGLFLKEKLNKDKKRVKAAAFFELLRNSQYGQN